jgi:hypothetical protein
MGVKLLLTASPGMLKAQPVGWMGGVRMWDLSGLATGVKQ